MLNNFSVFNHNLKRLVVVSIRYRNYLAENQTSVVFLANHRQHYRRGLFSSGTKPLSFFSIRDKSQIETSIGEMKVEEISIPVPWGQIRGQIFGDPNLATVRPIVCLHGYLDNSNSFKPLAFYLTKSNDYYMISLDFPGHGLSSKLPDGIPYTPKLFASSVRRAVRHLKLDKFYFLGHSYGIGTSIFYQTLFKNEVLGTVALDWIFDHKEERWENMSDLFRQGIDQFIDFELGLYEVQSEGKEKELTKELALSILLKANPGLDEDSGRLLLERALTQDENGKYLFTRDKKVKTSIMGSPDHYGDFVFLIPHIKIEAPLLSLHAVPASYGDVKGKNTRALVEKIRQKSSGIVESGYIEGSHHFHMIKPKQTAEIIVNFLNKIKSIEPVNSKL